MGHRVLIIFLGWTYPTGGTHTSGGLTKPDALAVTEWARIARLLVAGRIGVDE